MRAMKRHLILTLAVAGLLQACESVPRQPLPERPADQLPAWASGTSNGAPKTVGDGGLADGEIIRLDRSGCGFACPSYSLSVESNGHVLFRGRAHTAAGGEHESQLETERLGRLVQTLAAELPSVAGHYTPGSKACGQIITDQPTVTLALRVGENVVQSVRYAGCPAAPAKLAALENLVDATVGSGAWVQGGAAK